MKTTARPATKPKDTSAEPSAERPARSGFRDHDIRIRRFHLAGLVPAEIAVVLNSQGLRVKTWAVNETFVRGRLEAMDLKPHRSRTVFHQGGNSYRPRPSLRRTEF
jgi:hypothetical protein